MKCPLCNKKVKIINSRYEEGNQQRRRYICHRCDYRFSTIEVVTDSWDGKIDLSLVKSKSKSEILLDFILEQPEKRATAIEMINSLGFSGYTVGASIKALVNRKKVCRILIQGLPVYQASEETP